MEWENIYYKLKSSFFKARQLFFITKWGKLYYKVGQLAIYKYFSYYKVGQVLLQSGAGITKWGIITKWCITTKLSFNV